MVKCDPWLLFLYTVFLSKLINFHGLNFYLDDSQIYLCSQNISPDLQSLTYNCLLDISNWMTYRHLKMNISKIELMIFPPKLLTIAVKSRYHTISPVIDACNLTVILQSSFSLTPTPYLPSCQVLSNLHLPHLSCAVPFLHSPLIWALITSCLNSHNTFRLVS